MPEDPRTDEALMAAWVAGDGAAFRELFRRWAPRLHALMRRDAGSAREADDLVQETFLQLHRARADFRPGAPLRPWIVTIALNLKREHFRRSGRRRETPLQDAPEPSVDAPEPGRDDERDRVLAAMADLPAATREVIELHWLAGLPFPEVAAAVGASLSAVKVRAHRGYLQLRAALEGAGVKPSGPGHRTSGWKATGTTRGRRGDGGTGPGRPGVDCRDMEEALRTGRMPPGPEAAAHLRGCAACRALSEGGTPLVRALSRLAGEGDREDLLARVEARLARERGVRAWLRARSTPARRVLASGAALALGALVLLTTPRPDLAVHPVARMVLAVAALSAAAGVAAWLALRPLQSAPRAGRIAVALLAALAVPAVLSALPMAHGDHPAALAGVADDFARRAVGCLVFGTALGLPALGLARVLDRRSRPATLPLAAAAALAGAAGNLALQAHCPITHPAHLLAAHAPVGLLVAGGVLALARARRRTPAPRTV